MAGCAFDRCTHEETIGAWEWRQLLQLAGEHALDRGGYCDPRLGCINFSPT